MSAESDTDRNRPGDPQEGQSESGWIFTVLATLVAVFVASAALLAVLPETPQQGRLAARAVDASTEVLFVGTSHVYADMDPLLAEQEWMNLSAGMLNYQCAEGVLHRHIATATGLRAVVFEADELMAMADSLYIFHGDYSRLLALSPDLSAMDLDPIPRFELTRDQLLSDNPLWGRVFSHDKLDMRLLMKIVRGESPNIRAGFQFGEGSRLDVVDGDYRIRGHLEASPDPERSVPRNLSALRRMLELVQARGLAVVLVRLPHHESYREARTDLFHDSYRQIVETAREVLGDELILLDYDAEPDYADEFFLDADHLNKRGSDLFSPLLSRAVAEAITDHEMRTAAH